MSANFSKEEQNEIYKAYNLILDDLRRIWEAANVDKIKARLPFQYHSSFTQCITVADKYIGIEGYWVEDASILLEKTSLKKKVRPNPNLDLAIQITRNYEEIRKSAIESVREQNNYKDTTMQIVADIKKNYLTDATIEIDLGRTQNRHEIEVIEEDGKKIGTINFGNRTIKIITDGDIVLVNRNQTKPKLK